jgi:ABC-2 type transport system permease protein
MRSLAICRFEIKRFLRDRTALFFTAALPVIIILLIGTATAGFDVDAYPIGIATSADGPLARELVRKLEAHKLIDLDEYEDSHSLAKAVRRGSVPAGVTIPADYDEKLLAGKPVDVELVIDQTRGSPAAIRSLVAEVIAEEGAALQAAIFTNERTRTPIRAALVTAEGAKTALAPIAIGVSAKTIGDEGEEYLPPGVGYQAPSNLILFVFITSIAGAGALIQSRQLRVMQRMYSTPTSARAILFGEGLSRFAIAGYQAIFIFLVGSIFFRVGWGDPIAAFVLIVLFVLVGTSVGMLFGTVFSTPDQAATIGSMVGIGMGMLGGCMWPLEIVPDRMREIGHIFPHAWAMDAWIELIGRGGTISDIGTELAVLAAWVAVLMPLGTWRLRRALTA